METINRLKMTTLQKVYCTPTTQEEFDKFGLIKLSGHKVMILAGEPTLVKGDYPDRTEIPVQHFLDLLDDRIVGWRLEEIGFSEKSNIEGERFLIIRNDTNTDVWFLRANNGIVSFSDKTLNITTFADLLTLIRFLSPT